MMPTAVGVPDSGMGRNTTFRVQGLPAGIATDDAAFIIAQLFDTDSFKCGPTVHSLGPDPYHYGRSVDMVATVTFGMIPTVLQNDGEVEFTRTVTLRGEETNIDVVFDSNFLGFTPLNNVKDSEDHMIDCIAVSGLASHAFGSWKSRGGQFMWLRDDNEWRTPNVRVLLYGYDTTLARSESFQSIDNIGTTLANRLSGIRNFYPGKINYEPRPIVFIAHSLGGLVVKQAICKMAMSQDLKVHADCVYGLVFFGVPNLGIRIDQWVPMVQNQPNSALVNALSPGSQYLNTLQEQFDHFFKHPNSKILSCYETRRTKTATKVGDVWKQQGSPEILVNQLSATQAMNQVPPGVQLLSMQMEQNHADLPKFRTRKDEDLKFLRTHLQQFWSHAVEDIQHRIGSEDIYTMNAAPQFEFQRHATYPSSPQVIALRPGLSSLSSSALGHPATTLTPLGARSVSSFGKQTKDFAEDHSTQDSSLNSEILSSSLKTNPHGIHHSDPSQDRVHSPDGNRPGIDNSGNTANTSDLSKKGPDEEFKTSDRYYEIPGPVELSLDGDAEALQELLLQRDNFDTDSPQRNQALHYAAMHGDWRSISWLLERGANIHARNSQDATALHLAVSQGHFDITNHLLDHQVDIHAKTSTGHTAVHYVPTGRSDLLRLLLAAGASVDSRSSGGHSPLFLAVASGDLERFTMFLNHKADFQTTQTCILKVKEKWVEKSFERARTPLQLATQQGHIEIFKLLVSKGADIHEKHESKGNLLGLAASWGHCEIVQCLLNAGMKTEAKDDYSWTALHDAAFWGHGKVIKLLIEAGANIEVRTKDKQSPLMFSARHGCLEATRILLDYGANIQARCFSGWSAFHEAAADPSDNQVEVMKLLLERGASIAWTVKSGMWAVTCGTWAVTDKENHWYKGRFMNHQISYENHKGRLPIHYAALSGSRQGVKYLLDNGSDINAVDSRGRSPLHLAVRENRPEMAQYLIKLGANIHALDNDGWNVLHYAASNNNLKVMDISLEMGADINIVDKHGWTALHLAAHDECTEMLEFLLKKGAKAQTRNRAGQTPWGQAKHENQGKACKVLEDAGAEDQSKTAWFRRKLM